jgi:hypothetical protein
MEWADKTYVALKLQAPGFDKIYQMARGTPLNIARESMVLAGLGLGATHFFMIDSDVVFEAPTDVNQAISTLLQLNQPIVSGVYRAKQKDGFHYALWNRDPAITDRLSYRPVTPPPPPTNWFTVDVTGLGCSLIKREVFENISRPWFPWEFSKENDKEVGPSEDFAFYKKAKDEKGYLCWIFSAVQCSHIGRLKVRYDGSFSVLEV